MKTAAYDPPVGLDMKPEDAKVHVQRIRQHLVKTLLYRAGYLGVSVIQVLGGWNATWNVALAAGKWYERTFGSSRGYVSFLVPCSISWHLNLNPHECPSWFPTPSFSCLISQSMPPLPPLSTTYTSPTALLKSILKPRASPFSGASRCTSVAHGKRLRGKCGSSRRLARI